MGMFSRSMLVYFCLYVVFCTRLEAKDDPDLDESLKQVFKSQLNFTLNHAVGEPFTFTFSKKYLKTYYSFGDLKVAEIVTRQVHMDELCPDEYKYCFCSIIKEPKNFLGSHDDDMVLLKICSTESRWMQIKELFLRSELDAFSQFQFPNGTRFTYDTRFNANLYEQSRKDRRLDKDQQVKIYRKSWDSMEFDKHNPSLCPYRFEWCFCSMTGDVLSYFYGNRSNHIVEEPMVVVDCRPFHIRPFEKRDCSPERAETLPWYRRIFGPRRFPCGFY